MIDQALDSLKKFDWGMSFESLKPIDDAIVASHGQTQPRKDLELKLAGLLKSDASHAAKDFVCRKLMQIGSDACVPHLAGLLGNPHLSHLARYALERIPVAAAGDALRSALTSVSPELKVGLISSLGARREQTSVADLAKLVSDSHPMVARAASLALGAIQGPAAAKAIADTKVGAEVASATVDAALSCAESLLRQGDKGAALAIYKKFAGESQPQHVRLAATRGVLACAGTKQ